MNRWTYHSLIVLRMFSERAGALAGADIIRATGIASGTLYPILRRLEHAGLLRSAWERGRPSVLGRPRRRLYRVTADGVVVTNRMLNELGLSDLPKKEHA